jgi:Lrp/AsnC family transcriptional regulator
MDKFMSHDLDEYEKRILAILQVDASRSATDIAHEIGLSQAPCWRRIQRLKEEGYIRSQVCILDRRKLGLRAQIFAQVKLTAHGRANLADFSEAIRGFPRCSTASC